MTSCAGTRCYRAVIEFRTNPDVFVVALIAGLARGDVVGRLVSRCTLSRMSVTLIATCWRAAQNSMQVAIAAFDIHVRTKQGESRKQVIEIPAGPPNTAATVRG